MSERILRKAQVCEKLGGVSKTTLWRWCRDRKFPNPSCVSGSSICGWRESIVDSWISKNFNPQSGGKNE